MDQQRGIKDGVLLESWIRQTNISYVTTNYVGVSWRSKLLNRCRTTGKIPICLDSRRKESLINNGYAQWVSCTSNIFYRQVSGSVVKQSKHNPNSENEAETFIMGFASSESLEKVKWCGWVFELLQYTCLGQFINSILLRKSTSRRCERWAYTSTSLRLGSPEVAWSDKRIRFHKSCNYKIRLWGPKCIQLTPYLRCCKH